MSLSGNDKVIHQILAADVRFSRPSITDDQVWSLTVESGKPITISTTFGLRARRMLIFPEFSSNDRSTSNPADFYKFPQVNFRSTNFTEILFTPFLSLDAQLKIWVPLSQVITGQFTLTNTSNVSRQLQMDWLVQLDPLPGGQTMSSARMGMNTVLRGKTSNLCPLFYLTGGPEESSSVYPGLSIKMLLTPGATRQVTWVMASQASEDASFNLARHYSSHQLDVEQFKIEMVDRHEKIFIESPQHNLAESLNQSQNQAYQLIMPAVQQIKFSTFILRRDPDLGFHPGEEVLEINPEWCGQTIPDTWLMAQNLLPGRPNAVREFIQNILDAQEDNGWIDFQISTNHKFTGHLALPMLASLVCEVFFSNEDVHWLEGIYPRLVHFYQNWFSRHSLCHQELTHPVQIRFLNPDAFELDQVAHLWIKHKVSESPFLLSLLYRECKSLLQIEKWLKSNLFQVWLEDTQRNITRKIEELWDEDTGFYQYQDCISGANYSENILCEFKQGGKHKPTRKITTPGRLFIRLQTKTRTSPDFCCRLKGMGNEGEIETALSHQSFEWIGTTGIGVTTQSFSTLDAIEIVNWKKGDEGQIGQVDLSRRDITSLLPLWAGIPSPRQAEKILQSTNTESFLGMNGISFFSSEKKASVDRIPNFLAAMIIEGMLNYHRPDLAERFFRHHFDPDSIERQAKSKLSESMAKVRLQDLIPIKLFLAVCGIKKITPHEMIVTHFNRNPNPVTVQYNQTKMILRSDRTEIIAPSGEKIIIDQPQAHRIVFE